jgi:FHA domain
VRGEAAAGAPAGGGADEAPGGTFRLALALVERERAAFGGDTSPFLEVRAGPDRGKRLAVASGRAYLVGRDRHADLPLAEPRASRRHAEVTLRAGRLWVRDLGSAHGTWLGGARLEAHVEAAWPYGAELRVGDDVLVGRDPMAEVQAALERRAASFQPAEGPTVVEEEAPVAAPSEEGPLEFAGEDVAASAASAHGALSDATASPPWPSPEAGGEGASVPRGPRRWGAVEVAVVVLVALVVALSGAALWWLAAS